MTTQLSFDEALSSRVNSDQHSRTLALVREFPYRTARELAAKVNPDIITHDTLHKRLPELRAAGLVINSQSRTCTVTGKRAMTWVVEPGFQVSAVKV